MRLSLVKFGLAAAVIAARNRRCTGWIGYQGSAGAGGPHPYFAASVAPKVSAPQDCSVWLSQAATVNAVFGDLVESIGQSLQR